MENRYANHPFSLNNSALPRHPDCTSSRALVILYLLVFYGKKMTDKLKNKIERFLAMCLKSKSESQDNDTMNLTEEQHREIAEDAVAITNSLVELQRLLPISRQLAELGYLLEVQGKITVKAGEAYDEAALDFFRKMYDNGMSISRRLH